MADASAVKAVIGVPATDPVDAAKALIAKDWAECGAATAPADKQTYHDLVIALAEVIKKANAASKQPDRSQQAGGRCLRPRHRRRQDRRG